MNFNPDILNQAHCQAMDNQDDDCYYSDEELYLLLGGGESSIGVLQLFHIEDKRVSITIISTKHVRHLPYISHKFDHLIIRFVSETQIKHTTL